jgi:uncharacterized protein Usg
MFPHLNKFLNFWLEKLEGPLHSVTVAHARLIKPAEIRAAPLSRKSAIVPGVSSYRLG